MCEFVNEFWDEQRNGKRERERGNNILKSKRAERLVFKEMIIKIFLQ